jgi:hypothetical protein
MKATTHNDDTHPIGDDLDQSHSDLSARFDISRNPLTSDERTLTWCIVLAMQIWWWGC